MKFVWCWQCKCEMPMLDEDEYAEVAELYRQGIGTTKEFRDRWGVPLQLAPVAERFRPVRET